LRIEPNLSASKRAGLILFVSFLSITGLHAQRYSLPDIKGEYYYTGNERQKITSKISDVKNLPLAVASQNVKNVKVLRVTDKFTVIDVVTYFVDVMVNEPNSATPKKMEMVLVENLSNKRIRLELETGEEWIRPPVIADP